MIYFGQVTGVILSLTLRFTSMGIFGPFLTIRICDRLLHSPIYTCVRIKSTIEIKVSDKVRKQPYLECTLPYGYGSYIVSQKVLVGVLGDFYLFSAFLGLGSGMLTTIIGDSLQMVF